MRTDHSNRLCEQFAGWEAPTGQARMGRFRLPVPPEDMDAESTLMALPIAIPSADPM
jgi:hypothetical protein